MVSYAKQQEKFINEVKVKQSWLELILKQICVKNSEKAKA